MRTSHLYQPKMVMSVKAGYVPVWIDARKFTFPWHTEGNERDILGRNDRPCRYDTYNQCKHKLHPQASNGVLQHCETFDNSIEEEEEVEIECDQKP